MKDDESIVLAMHVKRLPYKPYYDVVFDKIPKSPDFAHIYCLVMLAFKSALDEYTNEKCFSTTVGN